jgi:hypothetical protein
LKHVIFGNRYKPSAGCLIAPGKAYHLCAIRAKGARTIRRRGTDLCPAMTAAGHHGRPSPVRGLPERADKTRIEPHRIADALGAPATLPSLASQVVLGCRDHREMAYACTESR